VPHSTSASLNPEQRAVLDHLIATAEAAGLASEVIETHAAIVVLAGGEAFKFKRAVRYPYLDYSTPALRRDACRRELALNRPHAPMIYRDVVALRRSQDGALAIGGAGEVVEWLLRMNRFPDRARLDLWMADHRPDPSFYARLGESIARAHLASVERDVEQWLADLGTYLDQNDAAFRQAPDLFAIAEVHRLDRAMRSALAHLTPLIQERGRIGLCRLNHGDLHMANIAVIDNEPVLFDAIEFDDGIATGDLLYDLAFLLMDLDVHGFREAAAHLVNWYTAAFARLNVAATERTSIRPLAGQIAGGYAAMPFYWALRAAIRAKIAATRSLALEGAAAEAARTEARGYFARALEVIQPVDPVLIAVGGLSGTGKSRLAADLAAWVGPVPGAHVQRSDVLRKVRAGVAMTQRLPADAYTAEATQAVYTDLNHVARVFLASGRSVIVDAVHARPSEREAIAQTAEAIEVRFAGLWLEAPDETRVDRIEQRRNDASDATGHLALAQSDYDLGTIGWSRVDASGSPEQTLAHAIAALRAAGLPLTDPAQPG
jgi:hypothetical protein